LDGHTILVDEGIYYEHVIVNRSISLIGENRNTTIIDGGFDGSAMEVRANDASIANFTLRHNADYGLILFSNNNSIHGNIIACNYLDGINIQPSNGNILANNIITSNGRHGILGGLSNHTRIIGNIISHHHDDSGIFLGNCKNNTLTNNSISDNYVGINLDECDANIITMNNMEKNERGLWLRNSQDNAIFHNNFNNSLHQVLLWGISNNTWDDGYPYGGNYWSDYSGFDSNHDGIGDSPYAIDTNNTDNYPLMGMFNSFNTSLGKNANVISNSTIEDFKYFESNGTIKMQVSNMTTDQTCGFCRICIPHELMNVTNISVIINGGATQVLYPNYTLYDNGTYRWIYFAYEHSTLEVVIVPEFSSLLIIPLLMVATLLVVIVYRRKYQSNPCVK
jgi:parallel beta-helix repeat protein